MTAVLKINDQLQKTRMASVAPYSAPLRRTVLVTGGIDGTGTAICKKMAELGHFVAATYQNEAEARAWQNKMEREGYLFYIYKCDVADFRELQELIRDVTADLGPLHILINNQDVISDDPGSICNVTRAAIDSMRATGFGRIVNISYAKAATHGFTKALVHQVAESGITVNTISRGTVTTGMSLSMPQNIAHVVSFLVSEESGFITGANIAANGGCFME